jgi:hypothetical protein
MACVANLFCTVAVRVRGIIVDRMLWAQLRVFINGHLVGHEHLPCRRISAAEACERLDTALPGLSVDTWN